MRTVVPIEIPFGDNKKQGLCYVASTHLYSACLSEERIVSKVVTIRPAYVIVNKTQSTLEMMQFQLTHHVPEFTVTMSKDQLQSLNTMSTHCFAPAERKPFHWADRTVKDKYVQFHSPARKWKCNCKVANPAHIDKCTYKKCLRPASIVWTPPFNLKDTGSLVVQSDNQEMFTVIKRIQDNVMFVFVFELPTQRHPFKIRNNSTRFNVTISQEGCKQETECSMGKEKTFIWGDYRLD